MTTSIDPTTPSLRPTAPIRRIGTAVALLALAITVMATWLQSAPAVAKPAPKTPPAAAKNATTTDPVEAEDTPKEPKAKKAPKAAKGKQAISGKLNLNTATVEQLTLLPGVGPSKAERVIAFRKKNGEFKRVADLRKVKGFGYKTIKKLEPYLDIKGTTTLASK